MVCALVSLMVWIGARDKGVVRRSVKRGLFAIWGSVVACVAGLVAMRLLLGQDISIAHLDTRSTVVLVLGFVWTAGWLLVALRAVRIAQDPSSSTGQE